MAGTTASGLLAAVPPAALAAFAAFLWSSRPERRGCRLLDESSAALGTGGAREPTGGWLAAGRDGGDRQGLIRIAAALAVGVAVWAFAPGGWGAGAAVGAALVTWRRSRTWEPASVRRRRERLEAELPWVVDLLTVALRAGLGPAEALTRVAEVCHPDVRRELRVPLARLRLGGDPVSVWDELGRHPELGRLGVTLRRATESGAPVAEALSRLGTDVRAGRRAAVEVRVRRIEVRAAVPLGVCLLPAFVLLAVVPLVAGSAAPLLGG